jgi:hypothetical protein
MVEYYIYSNEPGFEFEKEVYDTGDFDDFDVFDLSVVEGCFSNFFIDEIQEAIYSSSMRKRSQGFFPDPWQIQSDLFNDVCSNLEKRLGKRIFAKKVDDDGTIIPSEPIDLSGLIAQRSQIENGIIDAGELIIAMLKNFLTNGRWQYGFQCSDGTIIADVSDWPEPIIETDTPTWKVGDEPLNPVVWFGLKDEVPIECWTLDKSPERFDLLKLYNSPSTTEPSLIERWNSFWFNGFWAIDWNALFDNNGDAHITWMFAECGMDGPDGEFVSVKEACPIDLDRNDTSKDIMHKIDYFFLEKWKEADLSD